MSWWDVGNGDILGDRPADLVRAALREAAARRDARQQERPTMAEVLGALLHALNADEDAVLDDPSSLPLRALVARAQPAAVRADSSAAREPELEHLLREALRAVADAYQERWQRRPRLREVLETVAFILGYRPERFLAGATGLAVGEIAADAS